jgi:hypothetical protein
VDAAMASTVKNFLIPSLMTMSLVGFSAAAQSAENSQYRAVMTKIFLSRYRAMPVFSLNPVFPGDVITLKNETMYLKHHRCYPNVRVGKYTALQDYNEGASISLSGDLKIGGELIQRSIASVEVQGNIKFASTGSMILSPLAKDEVDTMTLQNPNTRDANCRIIGDLLGGKAKGFVLTQRVYHGRTRISVTSNFGAGVDATAQGELLKKLANVFKISEPEIKISGQKASFMVSESPGSMSLAIVPTGYSPEEVSRITNYLEGKRGADLEIAVREAITEGSVGELEKMKLRVEEILGFDELKNKEHWAENVVGTTPVEKFSNVQFEKVGTYAAAMELVRPEPSCGMGCCSMKDAVTRVRERYTDHAELTDQSGHLHPAPNGTHWHVKLIKDQQGHDLPNGGLWLDVPDEAILTVDKMKALHADDPAFKLPAFNILWTNNNYPIESQPGTKPIPYCFWPAPTIQ